MKEIKGGIVGLFFEVKYILIVAVFFFCRGYFIFWGIFVFFV